MTMIETLRDFVQKMEALQIDYMVTGSYAMAAYGEIRMTKDIDIVVNIGRSSVPGIYEAFASDYYINIDSVRRAVDRKGMFNIVSNLHGGKIDCIVQKDTEFARVSFSRRYRQRVADVDFWATTREDLIVAKLMWATGTNSEMQIRDIANLTRGPYDAEYVAAWVRKLQISNIWSEVERWKIQHEPPEM